MPSHSLPRQLEWVWKNWTSDVQFSTGVVCSFTNFILLPPPSYIQFPPQGHAQKGAPKSFTSKTLGSLDVFLLRKREMKGVGSADYLRGETETSRFAQERDATALSESEREMKEWLNRRYAHTTCRFYTRLSSEAEADEKGEEFWCSLISTFCPPKGTLLDICANSGLHFFRAALLLDAPFRPQPCRRPQAGALRYGH